MGPTSNETVVHYNQLVVSGNETKGYIVHAHPSQVPLHDM